MKRAGTWKITTEDGHTYLIDWDRLRYIDPGDVPAGVYGDNLWRHMVEPPATLRVGQPFEVVVAEWQPRRTEAVTTIEPFDWAPARPGPMNPPKRKRPLRGAQPVPPKPVRPTTPPHDGPDLAPEPLWTAKQLAAYLNVRIKTLYNWRTKGEGPPAISVGGSPRWEKHAVDRWIAERTQKSTGRPH